MNYREIKNVSNKLDCLVMEIVAEAIRESETYYDAIRYVRNLKFKVTVGIDLKDKAIDHIKQIALSQKTTN